jgi:hypothetical protein
MVWGLYPVNQLDAIADRRPAGGFSAQSLIQGEREYVACFTCRKYHPLRPENASGDYLDFVERHKPENGCICLRLGQEHLRRSLNAEQQRRKAQRRALRQFTHNSSVLEAYQAGQTLDLTGIGIATSVTAGWCSNWIDNSSALYLDILFYYYSQAVNTAASSQKEHVLFAPGSFASTDLPTNTAGNTVTNSSGTSATLTFLDYTANDSGFPIVARVPYITTNKALQKGLFGIAKAHDGGCPLFAWLAMLNAAGPTIGTGGGTPTKVAYRGSYLTIA